MPAFVPMGLPVDRCEAHQGERDSRIIASCAACLANATKQVAARRQALTHANARQAYQGDVCHVAQTALVALIQKDLLATLKDGGRQQSIQTLVDDSLIIGRLFVDELARLEPSKRYEENFAARDATTGLEPMLEPSFQAEPPPNEEPSPSMEGRLEGEKT